MLGFLIADYLIDTAVIEDSRAGESYALVAFVSGYLLVCLLFNLIPLSQILLFPYTLVVRWLHFS